MAAYYEKPDNGNTSIPRNKENRERAPIANSMFDFPGSPSHGRCNLLHYPREQSWTKT